MKLYIDCALKGAGLHLYNTGFFWQWERETASKYWTCFKSMFSQLLSFHCTADWLWQQKTTDVLVTLWPQKQCWPVSVLLSTSGLTFDAELSSVTQFFIVFSLELSPRRIYLKLRRKLLRSPVYAARKH